MHILKSIHLTAFQIFTSGRYSSMHLVSLSLPLPPPAHTHTHTHTRTHTHTPTHPYSYAHTYTILPPKGLIIIYPLGGGVGEFWLCGEKICLIPNKALQYYFNFPPLAVNWQSIFIVLLCTLLATADPHSFPPESHVIPLISFTHSTQEIRKNDWSPNTTMLFRCKARKERLEHERIVER